MTSTLSETLQSTSRPPPGPVASSLGKRSRNHVNCAECFNVAGLVGACVCSEVVPSWEPGTTDNSEAQHFSETLHVLCIHILYGTFFPFWYIYIYTYICSGYSDSVCCIRWCGEASQAQRRLRCDFDLTGFPTFPGDWSPEGAPQASPIAPTPSTTSTTSATSDVTVSLQGPSEAASLAGPSKSITA